jgi:IS6 family transposase
MVRSISGRFKWRQFEPEVILLAVGWYLRFWLSYRDVEALLQERGISVDHVTLWRWVQRYAPELEKRLRKRLNSTNDSWRVDETYVRVKGQWRYLYRAVDSFGRHPRFSLFGQAGRRGGQTVSGQSRGPAEPPRASGDPHRRPRRLPPRHCAIERGRCFG